MIKLPFKMRQETPMEKYRAETFWTKEPETLEWIRSFNPNDVFFDVGANIGVYSLYAASLFPGMLIYAIEPMIENLNALRENYCMNETFNAIFTMKMAMGSADGEGIFFSRDRTPGASGGQVCDAGNGDPVNRSSIDIMTCWSWPKPDHIKIDIDGQELEVVKGMQNTLPHIKSILIEVSRASKMEVLSILMAAGFTIDNRFNTMTPHSRERRAAEGIDAENIVFTR